MTAKCMDQRFCLLFAAFFLLVVLFMVTIGLEKIEQQTRRSAVEMLEAVLGATHKATQQWVLDKQQDASVLARSAEITYLTKQLLSLPRNRLSLTQNLHIQQLRKRLGPMLEENAYPGFFIISPDNISIASSRDVNTGTPNLISEHRPGHLASVLAGRDTFIPVMPSDVNLPGGSEQNTDLVPTAFVASPIRDEAGKVIAAFVIRMNIAQQLTSIMQLGYTGESGETYLFDADAILLTESRFLTELSRSGHVDSTVSASLLLQITDPGVDLKQQANSEIPSQSQTLTKMASSALNGNKGSSAASYRDYRGVPVLGAWLWDSVLGIGMATEIDEVEVLRSYHTTREIIIGILTLTVILGFACSYALFYLYKVSEFRIEKANAIILARSRALEATKRELEEANQQLLELANTDALTGLANRRSFEVKLAEEWRRSKRYAEPLSLIFLDVDYFKNYNDRYGHAAGDECLKMIATAMQEAHIASRPGDLLARYGGEEFIVILGNTSNEYALLAAEKLRLAILNKEIPHQASCVNGQQVVTISLGLATQDCYQLGDEKQLFKAADEALYRAKNKGRNCVQTMQSRAARIVMG